MKRELTERQAEVLAFLKSYAKANGMPPTRKDIAEHFGFESAAASQDHLVKLFQRGHIKLLPNIARGIVIL